MRWILIEEIIEIIKGKSAKTRSVYPQKEFSSEVLLIEMMAQTGGLLVGAESGFRQDLVFAKMEFAEFNERANPLETITIEASGDPIKPEGGWLDAKVTAGGRPLARSRFLLMNVGLLVPELNRPVTFNPEFMNHYQVLGKIK